MDFVLYDPPSMFVKKEPLTPKQKRFCVEYIVDFDGTKAAVRAGYSPKTAAAQASRLLKNVNVQIEIKRLIAKIDEKCEIKTEELLSDLKEISKTDIKELLTWDTKLVKIGVDKTTGEDIYDYRPVVQIKDPSEVNGKLISEVSLSPRGVLTIKTHNKLDAIDKLMRHKGLFEKDNEQNKTNVVIAIQEASNRAKDIVEKFKDKDKS